ncbi:MAG TPA: hypothetical protein VFB60_24660 [Ktedonobacteraceae bacterium]|nr:hypothetical protein [Ktedonobacteraceae bacterium]
MMPPPHDEPSRPSRKLTPLQIREQYHLNIAQLAQKAKVEADTVYFLMVGRPIARQQAEQILATMSALVGQSYTLDTVQVALLSEQQTGQPEDTSPADQESLE